MPSTFPVPGDLVRIRDEHWTVLRLTRSATSAVLDVRGRDTTNHGVRAAFLLPFELLEPLPHRVTPRRVRRRTWQRLTRATLADATPSWQSLRTLLDARISLLPFQLEPALAVTHGLGSRMLLADEVGLGKTIQAGLVIAEILARVRHGRILVVAPAALREQWQAELVDRFRVDAWLADAASLARLGDARTNASNPWSSHEVTITSIDFIKRPDVVRAVEALVWDAVVFDEAHGLTGRSDRAAAARALGHRARTMVLLTATPHSGDDRAFDALCDIGNLDPGFPLLVFRRTRGDVGITLSRRTRSLHVVPTPAERQMHRALMAYAQMVWAHPGSHASAAHLAMTILLRRACSSPASLARSVERRMALLARDEVGPRQMALPLVESSGDEEPDEELAAPGLGDAEHEHRRLEGILRLARHAVENASKVNAVRRLLRRTREPAIVFTEYRDTLETLATELNALSPVILHGGLSSAERRLNLRHFTAGTARLLLATDAASEGLNLQQRCRLVINLEIPWTPLRLEQRIGRVERIGQTRPVHAIRLIAAGTREESAVDGLALKSERAAAVLDALGPRQTQDDAAGIVIPDLREAARLEALRVESLRALGGRPSDPRSTGRPPITVLRRSRGHRDLLCGFRILFMDSDQQLVWETLFGAAVPVGVETQSLVALLELPLLAPALRAQQRTARASLEQALRAPLDLAARRERAIAGTLQAQRARLSAGLLQPGLFDRRAERLLDMQRAVLDEALERCRIRLDDIGRGRRLLAERPTLAFAVIRR